MLSPPCLLLIERANDDIIIYAFICVVPLCIHARSALLRALSWVIISLLTPMKYYPAAAYALFLQRPRTRQQALTTLAVSAGFLALLLFIIWPELQVIRSRIPTPPENCAVGASLLFQSFELTADHAKTYGKVMFLLGVMGAITLIFKSTPRTWTSNPRNESYFLLGSSLMTFCYVLNTNWDYRLALLIPTLPHALELLRNTSSKEYLLAAFYLLTALLTLWPEYLYFANAIDFEQRRWVLEKGGYETYMLIKHSASWLLIFSSMALSARILQHGTRLVVLNTPMPKAVNADSLG